jgi:hypothetical protein
VVTALECYCLCRLDPAYDPSPNWQQGIVLSTISESGIGFEPILFTRHLGKVVAQWRGKEYRQE